MSSKRFRSINPATEELLAEYPILSDDELSGTLRQASTTLTRWRLESLDVRVERLRSLGRILRSDSEEAARKIKLFVGMCTSGQTTRISTAKCCFDCGDIDFSHLHHCIERTFGSSGIGMGDCIYQDDWRYCQLSPHLSLHQPHSLS